MAAVLTISSLAIIIDKMISERVSLKIVTMFQGASSVDGRKYVTKHLNRGTVTNLYIYVSSFNTL